MLGGDDQVDLLAVIQHSIEYSQQGIRIGRQIFTDEFRFLVSQVAQQTRILVSVAVMVLLEYSRGCHNIQ
ncbi:hypothetical protein D3C71_2115610 [compost metagenome]